MRRGLEGLDRFMIEDEDDARAIGAPPGRSRRLEACQSPVWDTALAMIALTDAGVAPDDPAMLRAAGWLLGEEVAQSGDWAVARPGLAPGGWAFEFANLNYPDVDDTAEVVLALGRVANAASATANGGSPAGDGASATANGGSTAAGAGSVASGGGSPDAGLRPRDRGGDRPGAALGAGHAELPGGGWGAFDADNTRSLVRELPFLDFGEVIDEPSADVTAHAVEMLAALDSWPTPSPRARACAG